MNEMQESLNRWYVRFSNYRYRRPSVFVGGAHDTPELRNKLMRRLLWDLRRLAANNRQRAMIQLAAHKELLKGNLNNKEGI